MPQKYCRMNRVHERLRQKDRQTERQTDRQMDGRATAYSERDRDVDVR